MPRCIAACDCAPPRQRDLRLALDRFVRGAEALPEGVVVLDANNRIEWANPRAEAHLGLQLAHDKGAADRQPRPAARVRAVPRERRRERAGRSSSRPAKPR